jgi:hypothetical protein
VSQILCPQPHHAHWGTNQEDPVLGEQGLQHEAVTHTADRGGGVSRAPLWGTLGLSNLPVSLCKYWDGEMQGHPKNHTDGNLGSPGGL